MQKTFLIQFKSITIKSNSIQYQLNEERTKRIEEQERTKQEQFKERTIIVRTRRGSRTVRIKVGIEGREMKIININGR